MAYQVAIRKGGDGADGKGGRVADEPHGTHERLLDLGVIARNLRLLMADCDWTQAELAEAAKVSSTTVSRYVRGKVASPRVTELWNIAGAFGLTVSDLNRKLILVYADSSNGADQHGPGHS